MAKNIDVRINVTINESCSKAENSSITDSSAEERKPYDNREVKPGEVLVPMMVNDSLLEILDGVDRKNLRTWHMAGRTFRVAFYPIPAEYAEIAKQQYYSQLHEFLGEHRDARCLVPQSDGSYRVCPKKNGNNRPDCAHCPHHGEYEREDKTITSLDALLDEYGYDPTYTTNDTDPIMLKMAYEDLLAHLADKPRDRDIVSTGFAIGSKDGYLAAGDRKELVEKVMKKYGLKSSRAYQLVADVLKEVEKYLYD